MNCSLWSLLDCSCRDRGKMSASITSEQKQLIKQKKLLSYLTNKQNLEDDLLDENFLSFSENGKYNFQNNEIQDLSSQINSEINNNRKIDEETNDFEENSTPYQDILGKNFEKNSPSKGKSSFKGIPWSKDEDNLLISTVNINKGKSWKEISKAFQNRNSSQCAQRWRRIQPSSKRQIWTKEEDKTLIELVNNYGRNWAYFGTILHGRTGKQIRERYLNKLDPKINRKRFTQEDDQKIVELYLEKGPKWKEISTNFEGRPENMIKNRFYSHIRKKMFTNNNLLLMKNEKTCSIDSTSNYSIFHEREEKKEENYLSEEISSNNKINFFKDTPESISPFFNNEKILNDFSNCLKNDKLFIPPEKFMFASNIENDNKIIPEMVGLEKMEDEIIENPLERLNYLNKKKNVLEAMLSNVLHELNSFDPNKKD